MLGNMFFVLCVYFNISITHVILFLSTFQKQEKYKDTEPTAIDLFKEMHCSKTKGFSESVKKAIVSTKLLPLLLLSTLCNEPLHNNAKLKHCFDC